MGGVSEGRREQRKRETRAALHRAALEIVRDEGVSAATVDRIAERAGVSPRTFFNYFPTKEDALAGVDRQLPEQLAGSLLARPADEPLADGLRVVVLEQLRRVSRDRETWQMRAAVSRELPSISAAAMGNGAETARALTAAAYERSGTDPRVDPEPAVTTFIVLGAVRAAFWLYAARDFEGEIADLAAEALDR